VFICVPEHACELVTLQVI